MTEFLKNRFGKDTRYKEAEHLLSSSHVMNLKIDALASNQDANAVNETERQRQVKV